MISPEMLRRYHCFATIDEASMKALAMIAEETSVPAGTHLFSEGDPADALSIIVEGEVDIQYTLGTGERRTVDRLVAGDILGWSAVVEPYRMTAVATTRMDTRLLKIDARRLRELCERDPLVGYRLMNQVVKLLADRLDGARVQLAVVA
jgi:CRP-like cAMP-binding protein